MRYGTVSGRQWWPRTHVLGGQHVVAAIHQDAEFDVTPAVGGVDIVLAIDPPPSFGEKIHEAKGAVAEVERRYLRLERLHQVSLGGRIGCSARQLRSECSGLIPLAQ